MKKTEKETAASVRSAKETLISGAGWFIAMLVLGLGITRYFLFENLETFGLYATYAFVAMLVSKYFLMGVRKVPVAWQAVPLLFGTRDKSYRIEEGLFWLPRYIMSAEYVDMRQQTKNVREVPVISKDGVRMLIDTRLMFAIIDPYTTLSVEEEVINEGLEDLIIETLRKEAKKYTAKELATNVKTSSKKEDKKAVEGKEKQEASEIDLGGKIEEAAKESSKEWGIITNQVMVTKIIPQDESVIASWEKKNVEVNERDSEEVDRDHTIDSVELIAKRLGISTSEALLAFDDERGKMHGRKNIIITNANSPMENAAAILSNGLSNKE